MMGMFSKHWTAVSSWCTRSGHSMRVVDTPHTCEALLLGLARTPRIWAKLLTACLQAFPSSDSISSYTHTTWQLICAGQQRFVNVKLDAKKEFEHRWARHQDYIEL